MKLIYSSTKLQFGKKGAGEFTLCEIEWISLMRELALEESKSDF